MVFVEGVVCGDCCYDGVMFVYVVYFYVYVFCFDCYDGIVGIEMFYEGVCDLCVEMFL